MSEQDFRAAGYPWRFIPAGGIEPDRTPPSIGPAQASLPWSARHRSNRRTDTVRRIEAALGNDYAGDASMVSKKTHIASVRAATQAAIDAASDLLIAVGGGSVIVATRAVANSSWRSRATHFRS